MHVFRSNHDYYSGQKAGPIGGLQALMHELGLGYGLMNSYYCHISTHKFV